MCVSEIRKALGDDSRTPRYIETVHRLGYRFIAPVPAGPPAVTYGVREEHRPPARGSTRPIFRKPNCCSTSEPITRMQRLRCLLQLANQPSRSARDSISMHCEVLIAERRCAAVSNFGQLIQKDPRALQKSGIKTFTEPRIDLREGPISFIAAALSVEEPRKCRGGAQFPGS